MQIADPPRNGAPSTEQVLHSRLDCRIGRGSARARVDCSTSLSVVDGETLFDRLPLRQRKYCQAGRTGARAQRITRAQLCSAMLQHDVDCDLRREIGKRSREAANGERVALQG